MNKYEGVKEEARVGYDAFIADTALCSTEALVTVLYVMVQLIRVSLSAQKEAMITPSIGKNLGWYM